VYFAEHANNFRARYVVRHPWAGPIPCDEPKRGVWGRKPAGAPPSAGKTAASPGGAPSTVATAGPSGKPAAPTAAEQKLAAYLTGGSLPDLPAYAITFRAAEPPKPSPAPSGSAGPASPASAPAVSPGAAPGSGGGCGCRAAPERPDGVAWGALIAITAVAALRPAARRAASGERARARTRR
jgi:hypothetical protein